MPVKSVRPCKRRFRRRTVRVLVDYQVAGSVRCEYATTLGAGGMFVETEEPLPPGTQLKTRFRLPGRDVLHEVQGRVAWTLPVESTAAPASRVPGMGVEFVDAVAAARLARELERLPE
jgi:uncharacterized protein (TIGR02266 family)